MNGTPRLRSAYPSTPQSAQNTTKHEESSSTRRSGLSTSLPVPTDPGNASNDSAPVIPFDVIDAPSQRLYALAFYVGLLLWRSHDYWSLLSSDSNSLALFAKWVIIDTIFLYGLPCLRIPWLEWSSSTVTLLFLGHAFVNGLLMFRIPVWLPDIP